MSDHAEQLRLQKQDYLRQEILNGEYDPNDFKEFLDSIKEDGGSNVDIWTPEELVQVVRDYKASLAQREQEANDIWQSNDIWQPVQSDRQSQPEQNFDFDFNKGFEQIPKPQPKESIKSQLKETINPQLKESIKAPKQQFDDFKFEEKKVAVQAIPVVTQKQESKKPQEYDSKPVKVQKTDSKPDETAEDSTRNRTISTAMRSSVVSGDDEFYSGDKRCAKTVQTVLTATKDIQIMISGTEVVKGGLLTSSFLMYVITTKPIGWTVRRRFDEFGWLRSYLCRQYPYMIVPPITTKAKLKKPGPDMIKRRMAFFEKFLTNLLEYPEVLGNKVVEGFLKIDNDKQWKEFKKDADKIKKPQKLEAVIKSNGVLTMRISPELTDHVQKSAEMVNSTSQIYAKMRLLAKELQTQFDAVSNTVFNIGECFTQLYNHTAAFNNSVAIGANKDLENVYLTVNNMMVSWGGQLVGQVKIIQDGLENFFKYSDFEGDAIKDIIKVRQGLHGDYFKHKKALAAKKDAKQKDQQYLDEIKDLYAFYSYETFEQISHALEIKCKHYNRNFVKFAKNQSQNLNELLTHWSDSIAHLTGAKKTGQKAMDRAQFKATEQVLDVDGD